MVSSSSANMNPLFSQWVTEKLGKGNYVLWEAQVLAVVHGAWLEGYLIGTSAAPTMEIDSKIGKRVVKIMNPTYEEWLVKDQSPWLYSGIPIQGRPKLG